MANLDQLRHPDNLRRAWRWLRSNPDAAYKSYFRSLYQCYAIAEDGVIPRIYRLIETESADYPARTEKNVMLSDGTVLISLAPKLGRGTALTAKYARKHAKPLLHLTPAWKTPTSF